jgi:alpha-glucosidase
VHVNEIKQPVERPLVIEAGSRFLALGEAKLIDFSRMKFRKGDRENSLVAALHDAPTVEFPYTTPWRTIMIGRSSGELLENNYFYENLNDPCAIEDVSWIKPGKVIREVTLTTQGGLACVDFAAKNGLQYVEFDAGWYGPEGDENSNATTVTVDPARSSGPLDLHRIIEYAEKKGIGIIVYVNRRAMEKQLDEILPLYKSWGIKGVKYGFVQVGPQEWTAWLHDAVKKAAKNQLMVDIHDEYRPTGFSRTFPNLMTQEGIRGDEESPSNEHTLITLFTRMLAGAGDNTICYYAPRVTEKMGGHISQLAKAVMLYSPWQFLYWYDRPQGSPGRTGGAGSSEGYIQNHPELEFFKNLPTVWDETRVIEGEIGDYATIARKSGSDWFLGSLTGNAGKNVQLYLDFLEPNASYEAIIYSHDPGSESSTNAKIETQKVNAGSVLEFEVTKDSGLAVHFRKI